jgi:S1-C subfamily serine protease
MLMVPYDDLDLAPNVFTIGMNPDISPEGEIVVKGLWETSPADDAGLEAGDVILSFNSRKVTPSNLFELMQMLEDDGTPSITFEVADEDTARSIRIDKAFLF